MALVTVENLGIRYGAHTVLAGVNLAIETPARS